MKLKLLFLILAITGLSIAAGAQGALYSTSGSGNAGTVSVDWVLGALSTDGGPASTALPVQLGTISASMKNQTLLVQWTTETETHNDHFDIEVSSDGTHFKKIATVASKAPGGNSGSSLQYEYETALPALALGLGFLFVTGLFIQRKRNYRCSTVAFLLTVFFFTGCSKNGLEVTPAGSNLYLRIVQVDKDGTKMYSRIIKVTRE